MTPGIITSFYEDTNKIRVRLDTEDVEEEEYRMYPFDSKRVEWKEFPCRNMNRTKGGRKPVSIQKALGYTVEVRLLYMPIPQNTITIPPLPSHHLSF